MKKLNKSYKAFINENAIIEMNKKLALGGIVGAGLAYKAYKKYNSPTNKASRKFIKDVDEIEEMYPGVIAFFNIAKEWGKEVSPNEDRKLYQILKKMNQKKDIYDLSQRDLRDVYMFLRKRNVDDYDEIVDMFINAHEDEDDE